MSIILTIKKQQINKMENQKEFDILGIQKMNTSEMKLLNGGAGVVTIALFLSTIFGDVRRPMLTIPKIYKTSPEEIFLTSTRAILN